MSADAIALCTASGTCGIRHRAHLISWAIYMAAAAASSPAHWPRSARQPRRPRNCGRGPR